MSNQQCANIYMLDIVTFHDPKKINNKSQIFKNESKLDLVIRFSVIYNPTVICEDTKYANLMFQYLVPPPNPTIGATEYVQ